MTVFEAHAKLTKLIEEGHSEANLFTDYVEEGGEAGGFYLSNTSERFWDCGELSWFAEKNPNTPIVLINSHH